MSASPSVDNQPAPTTLEADTTMSVSVPIPYQSQVENNEAPQATEDSEAGEEEQARWAKSSSPLSQYDEDARGERTVEIDSEQEEEEVVDLGEPKEYRLDDEDEDMEIDMDDWISEDNMDIIEDDDEDDEQHNQTHEITPDGPVDRDSESTVQLRLSPSHQSMQSGGDHTPRNHEKMDQYDVSSDHEDGDENVYDDDDADERHSSVTSSTIPLTSLDDSPNQRHGISANRTASERHQPLGTSSSSEVLHKQTHIGDNLVESSTLSSLTETREVAPRTSDVLSHHDDDLTDLSESERDDDGNEDDEADENDDEDAEEDEGDENDGNGEEGYENVKDREEDRKENANSASKTHVMADPLVLFFPLLLPSFADCGKCRGFQSDQREKAARRTSPSPSLSPPSSVGSLRRQNDARKLNDDDSQNNGTSSGFHQHMASTSAHGNDARSPNKTLKLTLKLSRSPPNATSKENATELPEGEDKETGDIEDQKAEQGATVPSAQKSNPTLTSHGRKPSIFGSNTMEDEQQQEQDDGEQEDGELSEEEEDAGKNENSKAKGVADRIKPTTVEEESTGYSDAEAEEADSHKPQAKPNAKSKPTPAKASNQNTSSQTTSHPLERPPSTLSSAPSQPTLEALAALLKIEIKFAALRDQLYIERMNEITKEEEMVTNGTHRSLVYLHNILKARHDNLLRLADLRQKEFEIEAVRVRDWDKKTCMSWWNDSKDQLVKHEYESNARKRRRIEKDKHDFDMPKPVPKPLPPKNVTAQDRQARAFDWNAGPSITPLNTHEVSNDLLAMGIGTRLPYRNAHVPALAGIVPAQMNLAPYGRNQALNTTMSGGRMPYPGEEMMMGDSLNGIAHLDPSQHRQANNHHHHHHHHHHHPVPPAAVPNHRAQQSRQHQPYSSGVPIMDQTIYGQAQAQARREGRQIPTSMDPFDTGRRRERVPEDMEAAMNGMIASGPGSHRGDKHRRQVGEHGDFGPVDGPTTKKRKTGNDGYQLQPSANPSRSLLDVKVEMAESGVDPRLAATAASGSMIHHRSASPQHAANARRELAPANPLIASAPGLSASSQSFGHPPPSGFGATQLGGPVGEGSSHIVSSSLSAGPQQQPVNGQSMSLTAPAGSIPQPPPTTSGSWGYRFPTGATPGIPSSDNRSRFLAGMATARN
ncbi:hypothetical protein QFC22_001084 [Naganishia vaughanmartiniae]|uniref:Uncharacterized protein n=1 Tax=Naganishia vaughanmartiniae TaxID=1424756 RepID=A0ACC2XJW3_9TREE|nr:hypothetical protein QFC22_001084 [Naganishia vaughanmartiniae]